MEINLTSSYPLAVCSLILISTANYFPLTYSQECKKQNKSFFPHHIHSHMVEAKVKYEKFSPFHKWYILVLKVLHTHK